MFSSTHAYFLHIVLRFLVACLRDTGNVIHLNVTVTKAATTE